MTSSSTSRWESSTRPLVVRTVWVNGLRHAILTPSLAFPGRATSGRSAERRGRPSSPSSTSATSTASDESDRDVVAARPAPPEQHDLARCLVRWKLVVGQGGCGEAASGVLGDEDEGADADAEEEGEDSNEARPVLGAARAPPLIGSYPSTFQHLCVAATLPARAGAGGAEQVAEDEDAVDGPDAGSDTQPNRRQASGDVGPDLNPLSERVLQWLDLAGKATDGAGATTKSSLRRNVSTAGASRRHHSAAGVAAAPRVRKFYPVASSEVSAPGPERRQLLSAARRSISVDANLPPAPARPLVAEPRTSPPPPPPPPPPLIQTFHHVASSARTWHGGHGGHGQGSQARPQLHIFVPAVAAADKGSAGVGLNAGVALNTGELAELQEVSDCESGISDA